MSNWEGKENKVKAKETENLEEYEMTHFASSSLSKFTSVVCVH